MAPKDKSKKSPSRATAGGQSNSVTPSAKRNMPDSGFSPPLTQVKRQSSLPDLFSASTEQGNLTNDMEQAIINALSNPLVHEKLVTSIAAAVMKKLDRSVEQLTKSVHELENSVLTLSAQNKSLKSQVADKDVVIDRMKSEISELQNSLQGLQNSADILSNTSSLSVKLDDLEQYGRRNSVRIHNLKCASHNEVLPAVVALGSKIGVSISKSDIVRCHMIGKPKDGMCQGIVKFVHYWKRSELFENAHKLKGNSDKTFISEDLTRRNHDLIKSLLKCKLSGLVTNVWSRDGRIFYRAAKDSAAVLVKSSQDIPHN